MPRNPQRSGQSPQPFTSKFAAHVLSVPEGRRAFVAWMHHTSAVDDESVEDMEVVFSELAANAVAASPDPEDEVRVRAELDVGMLVLEVSNRTADPERVPRTPDLDDPLRSNGRGLLIARAFVDSVDVEVQEPDRLLVRCCRRLQPPR